MSTPKQLSTEELDAIRAWFRGPGTEQFQTGEVIAMLLDHIDWQREEEDFYYTLNGRLAKILNDTANALKGPPDELALHSTHDLAAVAAALVNERREAVGTMAAYYDRIQKLEAANKALMHQANVANARRDTPSRCQFSVDKGAYMCELEKGHAGPCGSLPNNQE
jgi:hypothetical protein